jgi:iron complex outermembrane receptor protein
MLQYTSRWGATGLGVEWRKEDILSSKLGKEIKPRGNYKAYDERINTSVAIEHTVQWDKWVFSAGALLNHNTFISNEYALYPSLNASFHPFKNTKIAASWSRSTRMPTFTELYYNTETHQANENLKPEKSESADLSFNYRINFFEINLTGFLFWGKDMIDWIKATEEDKAFSSNLTKVNTQGIESVFRFRLFELLPALGEESVLSAGYTRMFQEYNTNGHISQSANALNYLRDKFTLQFNHRIYGKLSAGWYFRAQKRMGVYEKFENYRSVGRFEPYSAFSTLDLRLSYRYRDWAFHLNANNLYDTHYFDWGNIVQPGFQLSGGISLTLK